MLVLLCWRGDQVSGDGPQAPVRCPPRAPRATSPDADVWGVASATLSVCPARGRHTCDVRHGFGVGSLTVGPAARPTAARAPAGAGVGGFSLPVACRLFAGHSDRSVA